MMEKLMRLYPLLALSAALAGCQAQQNTAVEHASVERGGDGDYQLAWNSTGAPVDIYLAQQPDAAKDAMRLVVDNDRDGRATVQVPATNWRPYFFVVADGGTGGGGTGVWTAERALPLEGGVNFRDLGGYATGDGKRVKWGKLYRSGSMGALTAADYTYLSNLGIKVVCDLRTNEERAGAPNKWVASKNVSYWSRDYSSSKGELAKILTNNPTPERVKAAMTDGYRRLPYEQAPAYREIFKRLAAGEIPLAFNCMGGKDRAGIGSALILTVLGVPRETIIADYAMSEKLLNSEETKSTVASSSGNPFSSLPPAVLEPLRASDPDYLRTAFSEIEKRSGSVDKFLKKEVGVTDSEIGSIRKQLIE